MIGNAQTHTHPWRLVLLLLFLLCAVFIQRTEGVCTYETVALSRRINGRNLRGDDDDDGRCALVYDGPWDRWTSEPEQQRSRCDPCIARDPSLRVSFTCTLRPEIRIFIELALDRSLLDHGRCGARTRHTHTQVFSLRAFDSKAFGRVPKTRANVRRHPAVVVFSCASLIAAGEMRTTMPAAGRRTNANIKTSIGNVRLIVYIV